MACWVCGFVVGGEGSGWGRGGGGGDSTEINRLNNNREIFEVSSTIGYYDVTFRSREISNNGWLQ